MRVPRLKPGSRVVQTLQALHQVGDCSTHDYLRILKMVSDSQRLGDSLGNDLMVRGLVERRVVLTDKARRALEALQ